MPALLVDRHLTPPSGVDCVILRSGVAAPLQPGNPGAVDRPERKRLELRVLGPLAVVSGDRILEAREVGSRKGRLLLGLLLARRGGLVPIDVITDVLWSDAPPAVP